MSEAPEPRANPLLLGHEDAETTILEALNHGRLHHAWLLTGAAGIGKATLAFRFARRLFAQGHALSAPEAGNGLGIDPDSAIFRRVAAGTHADLLTVERAYDEKRKKMRGEIVVDDIRAVSDFLRLTPAEGGWRVVIVDGAEHLNRNAANALLKLLEEPPQQAILLLVCAAPGRLLPTIRSRCRRLRLSPLDDNDMSALMAQYLPQMDTDAQHRLTRLSEGAPGKALLLAEGEGLELASTVEDILDAAPRGDLAQAYDLADRLGRMEDGFNTFMTLLRTSLAARVRDMARQSGAGTARAPLEAWGEVWHALTQIQDETERYNLDKRQAIVSSLQLVNGA